LRCSLSDCLASKFTPKKGAVYWSLNGSKMVQRFLDQARTGSSFYSAKMKNLNSEKQVAQEPKFSEVIPKEK